MELASRSRRPQTGPFRVYREEGLFDIFPSDIIAFTGRNEMLEGIIGRTQEDVILQVDEEYLVPEGTGYLAIHFDVKERNIYDGQLRKVIKTMRKGAEDMLDLAAALDKDEELENIDLVVGTTNPRLARLAIRKLGFHIYGEETPYPMIVEPEQTIYISKREIMARAEEYKATRKRLKKLKRK